MQIVQAMSKRTALNQSGLKMYTIYLPNHPKVLRNQTDPPESMCINQIDEVCTEIEQTIALTIQTTLKTMAKDIGQLEELVRDQLSKQARARSQNWKNIFWAFLVLIIAVHLPLATYFYYNPAGSSSTDKVKEMFNSSPLFNQLIPESLVDGLVVLINMVRHLYFFILHFIALAQKLVIKEAHLIPLGTVSALIITLVYIKSFYKHEPVWPRSKMIKLRETLTILDKTRRLRQQLFDNFIKEII